MDKINEIEKMLTTANTMLLELKKENEVLKEENLTLQNKIILLEKMVMELQGNKKHVKKTVNKNEKTLKQDLEILEIMSNKKHFFLNGLIVQDGLLFAKDGENSLKIINYAAEGQGFYDLQLYKKGIFSEHKEGFRNSSLEEYYKNEKTFEKTFEINSSILLDAFEKLQNYMHKDNTATQGIYLKNENNILNFVANDGFRMNKTELENNFENNFEFLVPEKIVKILLKDLKGVNTELKIQFNENEKGFFINYLNRKIFCKGIELSYPNFKQIYESTYKNYFFEVNKIQLEDYLKKSKEITIKKEQGKFGSTYKIEGNILMIKSEDNKGIEITENLEINTNYTEDISFCLSDIYVLEFLKACKTEKIKINFQNNRSQFTFENALIMPLALREV